MKEPVVLEIENVGGFAGKHRFKLHAGLNVARASNAVGKTSLTRAIDLLALSDSDLQGKGYYANQFMPREDQVVVRLANGSNVERRFRRVGERDLKSVSGPSPFQLDGQRVASVCFAVPDNELIRSLLAGESVNGYIEKFSDSEYYDVGATILRELEEEARNLLSSYRDDLIRLESLNESQEELAKERTNLEQSLTRMPTLDSSKIFANQKKYSELKARRDKVEEQIAADEAALLLYADRIKEWKSRIKFLRTDIDAIEKKFPRLEEGRKKLVAKIEEVKTKRDDIETEQRAVDRELKGIEQNEAQISKFGRNKCFACDRPLTLSQVREIKTRKHAELDALGKDRKEAFRELEDLKEELEDLDRAEARYATQKDELRRTEEDLARAESDEQASQKRLSILRADAEALGEEIEKLSSSVSDFKQWEKREEVRHRLGSLEKQLKELDSRIKELTGRVSEVEFIEKNIEFLQAGRRHLQTRKEQLVEAVRAKFNESVMTLYKAMGFRDFDEIHITPDYAVRVVRKSKDFPLEALATSERITIAIALLMAAKQEFLPNFPFFILDELVTSYDPKRFTKMKEFVKTLPDYVIMTQLDEKATQEVMVTHEA